MRFGSESSFANRLVLSQMQTASVLWPDLPLQGSGLLCTYTAYAYVVSASGTVRESTDNKPGLHRVQVENPMREDRADARLTLPSARTCACVPTVVCVPLFFAFAARENTPKPARVRGLSVKETERCRGRSVGYGDVSRPCSRGGGAYGC